MRKADHLTSNRGLPKSKTQRTATSFATAVWQRMMRMSAIVTGCLALGTSLSGCDTTTDSQYFRYGIGTDLYSSDIAQTTQLQDLYFTELCRQALPLVSTTDVDCIHARMSANDWNTIVRAGMNDVDRRCDAYLAWLDDRRRTNSAVLKELGDLTVASQAIMRVAGVSANPITLAGLAFGLASNTFTNINSHLLLEIDKTTVQTLVLHRRDDFRIDIANKPIPDRPTAVHALRLYLTICTPFAIETDINSTVTVFQTAGVGGLSSMDPLVNPQTIGMPLDSHTGTSHPPSRPTDQLPVIPEFKAVIVNYDPKVYTAQLLASLARKLCLADADTTNVSKMKAAIDVFQLTRRDLLNVRATKITGRLSDAEILSLDDAAKCDSTQFKNFYEATLPGGIKNVDVVGSLNNIADGGQVTTNSSDSQIRTKILEVRKSLPKLTLANPDLASQMTPDLFQALQNASGSKH